MPLTQDRFAGCLIGQCVGDALGFLVEGEPPNICEDYARDVVRAGKVPKIERDGFAYGQYSDDSQLARELMISFAERRHFDPADYAARIAALFVDNRIVGRGRTTSQAAERLAAGISWTESGIPAPAAGNGAAMRAGPVGVICWNSPEALIRMACDQARITHANPCCLAGAVAVAGAVALAGEGKVIERRSFLKPLRDWTIRIDPVFTAGLRRMEDCLDMPVMDAAREISRIGLPPGVEGQWRGGISAYVVGSVLWALYAFLRSPRDYLGAVATAITPGGDVDTMAAMAGAIAGAHLGLRAIPIELVRPLNDRGSWRHADLMVLANDCWKLRQPERRQPRTGTAADRREVSRADRPG